MLIISLFLICSDAYSYFSLPFCPPGGDYHIVLFIRCLNSLIDIIDHVNRLCLISCTFPVTTEEVSKRRSLNEILAGDCLTNTQYELKFGVSESEGFLCEKYMTEDDLRRFKFAIANKFEYQMYFDKIWFGSKVGEVIEETGLGQKFYLFNHIEFNVDFMENQVMGISVVNSFDSAVDITNFTETLVEFSYSVFWNEIKPIDKSSYFISGNKATAEKASWVLEEDRRLFLSSLWLWSIMAFWWIILPLAVASPYLFRYFLRSR